MLGWIEAHEIAIILLSRYHPHYLVPFETHQPWDTAERMRKEKVDINIVGIYDSCSTNQLTTRN